MSHTITANSVVDWTPARLLLALQQLYKKSKIFPKISMTFQSLLHFP